jgi:hypothetical protein
VHHVRGRAADAEESALLLRALDCCGEDPDLAREHDALTGA